MSDGDDPPKSRPESDEPLADIASEVRERAGDELASGRADRPQREGPLADVASEVDERRRKRDERSDAFESVDVGELDGEKLWERLAEDEDADDAAVTVPLEEATPADETELDDDGRDVRTIPKDTCHSCPHFGDPPELACTHEGTDILAMPDSDHFRVADCPMVVEEEDVSAFGPEAEDGEEAAE
jgi:hypothetical protein